MKTTIKQDFIIAPLAIIISVVTIISLWGQNLLLFALLGTLILILLSIWHKELDVLALVLSGIIGPVAEIICISHGVWAYANPSFLGIPIWLPLAWGIAMFCLQRFLFSIEAIRGKND